MEGNAHLNSKVSGYRLFCRAGDLDDKGVPLFHPLIIPAFVLFIAGLVVTIVGWATSMIPLIGALVLVPLTMVYCMGVKSFHGDCRKCCRKCCTRAESPDEPDAGVEGYVGHENWSIGAASKRAIASPKRIGKRQSQLMAEKEKIRKANNDLNLTENGTLPPEGDTKLKTDVNKNGDVLRNGSSTSSRRQGDVLPDVESPSHIALESERSPSARSASSSIVSETENREIKSNKGKNKEQKTDNTDVRKTSERQDGPDSQSEAEEDSNVTTGRTGEGQSSPSSSPIHNEATNKAFMGDTEDAR